MSTPPSLPNISSQNTEQFLPPPPVPRLVPSSSEESTESEASSLEIENLKGYSLKPRQDLVYKRFTQSCDNIKGMLFIHNVGSGKTLTSTNMALQFLTDKYKDNDSKEFKIVIVVPTGLFKSFQDDIKKNIAGIFFDDNKTVHANDHIKDILEYKFSYFGRKGKICCILYKNLNAPISGTPTPVGVTFDARLKYFSEYIEDSVVIFDEAHRLLRPLLSTPNTTSLCKALTQYDNNKLMKNCHKFILMTGTPIQNSIDDIRQILEFVSQDKTFKSAEKYLFDNLGLKNDVKKGAISIFVAILYALMNYSSASFVSNLLGLGSDIVTQTLMSIILTFTMRTALRGINRRKLPVPLLVTSPKPVPLPVSVTPKVSYRRTPKKGKKGQRGGNTTYKKRQGKKGGEDPDDNLQLLEKEESLEEEVLTDFEQNSMLPIDVLIKSLEKIFPPRDEVAREPFKNILKHINSNEEEFATAIGVMIKYIETSICDDGGKLKDEKLNMFLSEIDPGLTIFFIEQIMNSNTLGAADFLKIFYTATQNVYINKPTDVELTLLGEHDDKKKEGGGFAEVIPKVLAAHLVQPLAQNLFPVEQTSIFFQDMFGCGSPINIQKLANDSKKFVSLSYSTIQPPIDDTKYKEVDTPQGFIDKYDRGILQTNITTSNYPDKKVCPILVEYTETQIEKLLKIFGKTVDSIQRIFWGGLPPNDEIKRIIGNYSPYFQYYKVKPKLDGNITYELFPNLEEPPSPLPPVGIFSCPKFEYVLANLIFMKTGYMITVGGSFIPQPHFSETLQDTTREPGGPCASNVPPLIVTDPSANYGFLPIVYSTSDEYGLGLFAIYLKTLELDYLLLHDEDGSDFKNSVVEICQKSHELNKLPDHSQDNLKRLFDTILSYVKTKDTASIKRLVTGKLCILLHKEITEGIDLKYNPAIFLLEPPTSFCNYEQLCGRVLRTYKVDYAKGGDGACKLPIKLIYQCIGVTMDDVLLFSDGSFFGYLFNTGCITVSSDDKYKPTPLLTSQIPTKFGEIVQGVIDTRDFFLKALTSPDLAQWRNIKREEDQFQQFLTSINKSSYDGKTYEGVPDVAEILECSSQEGQLDKKFCKPAPSSEAEIEDISKKIINKEPITEYCSSDFYKKGAKKKTNLINLYMNTEPYATTKKEILALPEEAIRKTRINALRKVISKIIDKYDLERKKRVNDEINAFIQGRDPSVLLEQIKQLDSVTKYMSDYNLTMPKKDILIRRLKNPNPIFFQGGGVTRKRRLIKKHKTTKRRLTMIGHSRRRRTQKRKFYHK